MELFLPCLLYPPLSNISTTAEGRESFKRKRGNFIASRLGHRGIVLELQGQEKIRKMLRSRFLNGGATTNIVLMQQPTTLWPEKMVTLSR